ncbi:MAG: DUF2225 domain-containing protein, partial [Spirochaetota bacterium]|nr:DUF2225 domain-containing protein [Spirochaetota bacterium]
GGGRLIAGTLSLDLRRNYEENKKFGTIIPMIYSVTVCPECYYAVLSEDFLSAARTKDKLESDQINRSKLVHELFPNINFRDERNIEHGLLSYILALESYKLFDKRQSPTLKRGICALRASWLCNDMYKHYNKSIFKTMEQLLIRKSAKYYGQALAFSQNATEPFDSTKSIGPDTDKNFGYEGFLYLAGYLNYKLADSDTDLERKGKTYIKVKRIMGKLYGGGRASKDKPTAILNFAKDLYDELREKVKEIESTLGKSLE